MTLNSLRNKSSSLKKLCVISLALVSIIGPVSEASARGLISRTIKANHIYSVWSFKTDQLPLNRFPGAFRDPQGLGWGAGGYPETRHSFFTRTTQIHTSTRSAFTATQARKDASSAAAKGLWAYLTTADLTYYTCAIRNFYLRSEGTPVTSGSIYVWSWGTIVNSGLMKDYPNDHSRFWFTGKVFKDFYTGQGNHLKITCSGNEYPLDDLDNPV